MSTKKSSVERPPVDDLLVPTSCGLGSRIAALAVWCDRVADYADNLSVSPKSPAGRNNLARPGMPHQVGKAATPARRSSQTQNLMDLHRKCDDLAGKAERSASSAANAITTIIERTTDAKSELIESDKPQGTIERATDAKLEGKLMESDKLQGRQAAQSEVADSDRAGSLLENMARTAKAATCEALAEAEVLASTSRRFCEAAHEELCNVETQAQKREQQLLLELSEAGVAERRALGAFAQQPISEVQQLILDLKAEAAAAKENAKNAEDARLREAQARRKAEQELEDVQQILKSLMAHQDPEAVPHNSTADVSAQIQMGSKKNSYGSPPRSRISASPRSDVTLSPQGASKRPSTSHSPRRLWPDMYQPDGSSNSAQEAFPFGGILFEGESRVEPVAPNTIQRSYATAAEAPSGVKPSPGIQLKPRTSSAQGGASKMKHPTGMLSAAMPQSKINGYASADNKAVPRPGRA